MEINGPIYPPLPLASHHATQRQPSQANEHARDPYSQHQPQIPRPVRNNPTVARFESDSSTARDKHRFTNRDVEMSRPAQKAIHSYATTDLAGGPELLSRVDVFV